jgi:hypothetical protein
MRISSSPAFAAVPARFLVALVTFAIGASAQTWTDRAEYDLALAIRAESAPDKRLALIGQWKEKYPQSQLRQMRSEIELAAFESAHDWPRVHSVAKEMLKSDPRNFVGAYWVTLLATRADSPSPEALVETERAAHTLLTGADSFFKGAPTGPAGADLQKQRLQTELLAHKTLGWVEWQRGSYEAAEREFRLCLEKDSQQAEVSGWLGTVLGLQKEPAKQLQAIWHLARAASVDGEGGLSPSGRREARSVLERVYASYHGSVEGVDQIAAASKASAAPPADFSIETAEQVAIRKEDEELSRTNPQLAAWVKIRRKVTAPDGAAQFETLRTAPMQLKGVVVSCTPAGRPTEIAVAFGDPAVTDVILKVDPAFANGAEPGTPIEFEATPQSFTADPFVVTMTARREQITGWPARKR